jgi:hypothetical protein
MCALYNGELAVTSLPILSWDLDELMVMLSTPPYRVNKGRCVSAGCRCACCATLSWASTSLVLLSSVSDKYVGCYPIFLAVALCRLPMRALYNLELGFYISSIFMMQF